MRGVYNIILELYCVQTTSAKHTKFNQESTKSADGRLWGFVFQQVVLMFQSLSDIAGSRFGRISPYDFEYNNNVVSLVTVG